MRRNKPIAFIFSESRPLWRYDSAPRHLRIIIHILVLGRCNRRRCYRAQYLGHSVLTEPVATSDYLRLLLFICVGQFLLATHSYSEHSLASAAESSNSEAEYGGI